MTRGKLERGREGKESLFSFFPKTLKIKIFNWIWEVGELFIPIRALHLSLRQKELSAALSSSHGEVFVTWGWMWGAALKWLGFVTVSGSQRTSMARWGTCCAQCTHVDWLICSFFVEYFHSHYSNKISDAKQLTLSLDFTFLYASDKYDLSSQKKTFGKDDVGTSKHTLYARRKSFCKLDGSCWAFSFGAL